MGIGGIIFEAQGIRSIDYTAFTGITEFFYQLNKEKILARFSQIPHKIENLFIQMNFDYKVVRLASKNTDFVLLEMLKLCNFMENENYEENFIIENNIIDNVED